MRLWLIRLLWDHPSGCYCEACDEIRPRARWRVHWWQVWRKVEPPHGPPLVIDMADVIRKLEDGTASWSDMLYAVERRPTEQKGGSGGAGG